jgi:phospholipid/cholesterol/gamma-HCH transport system permease protein
VFKGGVFGMIIGLAGCMKGLQTGTTPARSAAQRRRRGLGITLIIVANAVVDWLAALLQHMTSSLHGSGGAPG